VAFFFAKLELTPFQEGCGRYAGLIPFRLPKGTRFLFLKEGFLVSDLFEERGAVVPLPDPIKPRKFPPR
jgi:hypothetical protein